LHDAASRTVTSISYSLAEPMRALERPVPGREPDIRTEGRCGLPGDAIHASTVALSSVAGTSMSGSSTYAGPSMRRLGTGPPGRAHGRSQTIVSFLVTRPD
jgi:hypothetical protein